MHSNFWEKCMYGFSNKITLCDRVNYLFPRLFLSQFLWRLINHSIVPFLQRTSKYTKRGVVKIYMRPVLGMISNCYGKQLKREYRSILVHSEAMWYKSKCWLWFFFFCMEWKLQQISLSVNCSISMTWFECLIWTKDTRVKEINFL